MTPATLTAAPTGIAEADEQRFLIESLSWEGYLRLLKAFGDRGPRISYLDGMAELMSPGPIHEQFGDVLGTMVKILTVELDISCKSQGSTTIRRRNLKKGLEADRCYYLESLPLLRGKDLKKLKPFPRPDLAIEVEVTAPLLPKLEIYAGLGVPEVWRHDRSGLTVLVLGPDGRFAESPASRAFPFLPMDGFRAQLAAYDPDAETACTRAYWAWVRDVVAPLHQPGPRPPHGD